MYNTGDEGRGKPFPSYAACKANAPSKGKRTGETVAKRAAKTDTQAQVTKQKAKKAQVARAKADEAKKAKAEAAALKRKQDQIRAADLLKKKREQQVKANAIALKKTQERQEASRQERELERKAKLLIDARGLAERTVADAMAIADSSNPIAPEEEAAITSAAAELKGKLPTATTDELTSETNLLRQRIGRLEASVQLASATEQKRQEEALALQKAREHARTTLKAAELVATSHITGVSTEDKAAIASSAGELKQKLVSATSEELISSSELLRQDIARIEVAVKEAKADEAKRHAEEETQATELLKAKTGAMLALSDANALTSRGLEDQLLLLVRTTATSLEDAVRRDSLREITVGTSRLADQIAMIKASLPVESQAAAALASPGTQPNTSAAGNIPAPLQKRVALVTGNNAYAHVAPLRNPINDASDMATALRKIGFEVTHLENLDKDQFEEALADFSDDAVGADFAIVYFAGHGIEIDKQNYLVPVDAELKTDRRLRFEAISLDEVMATLEAVKGIRMVLLDACRNNPFAQTMTMTLASRSVGRGLTRVEAANGTVISFSAKEGTVAADGSGRNSPFTAALLANIATPGLELQFLLRRVRDAVRRATNDEQEPFISASLPGEAIYLVSP